MCCRTNYTSKFSKNFKDYEYIFIFIIGCLFAKIWQFWNFSSARLGISVRIYDVFCSAPLRWKITTVIEPFCFSLYWLDYGWKKPFYTVIFALVLKKVIFVIYFDISLNFQYTHANVLKIIANKLAKLLEIMCILHIHRHFGSVPWTSTRHKQTVSK